MESYGLTFQYLNGDLTQPDVETEYEELLVDDENEEITVPFKPAGADGGEQLVIYLEQYQDPPDHLRPLEDYDDPEDELLRRLPELGTVLDPDGDLYDRVRDTFIEDVPESYWHKPASATGYYHPPDERQMHGQWIHTKRVLQETQALQRSLEELEDQYGLETDQTEQLGAAAALHDITKYGIDGEKGHIETDHAEKAQELLEDTLPAEVTDAIAGHDGPWGTAEPETMQELFTHVADLQASQIGNKSLLYRPKPELKFIDLADQLTEIDPDTAFYTVQFS